jgi:hypothetical protein
MMGLSFVTLTGVVYPPLPCRASPPQGGRSTRSKVSSFLSVEIERRRCALPISPLEGEMPGRAEGGIPCANFAVSCPEPATPC